MQRGNRHWPFLGRRKKAGQSCRLIKKKSTVNVGADSLKCWTEGKKDVEVELVKLGSAQMITVSQIHAE